MCTIHCADWLAAGPGKLAQEVQEVGVGGMEKGQNWVGRERIRLLWYGVSDLSLRNNRKQTRTTTGRLMQGSGWR